MGGNLDSALMQANRRIPDGVEMMPAVDPVERGVVGSLYAEFHPDVIAPGQFRDNVHGFGR